MHQLLFFRRAPSIALVVLIFKCLGSTEVAAKEFVVRQVTNFDNPSAAARPIPVAAINDSLIFLARENGQESYYRTDGKTVEPILNPNGAERPWESPVKFGNELYFAAEGVDGQELYATDAMSIRQVADLAPGSLSSNPRRLKVVGNHLTFNGVTDAPSGGAGAPVKFFHSDGSTIEEFSIRNSELPYSSAMLDGKLIFGGTTSQTNSSSVFVPRLPYVTDGVTVTPISTLQLVSRPNGPSIVRAGSSVFFHAGNGAERGFYRTDGTSVELVSTLIDLVPSGGRLISLFELDDSLHIAMHDTDADELIFFRGNSGTPSEVFRWAIPDEIELEFDVSFFQNPVFNNSSAIFSLGEFTDRDLYHFNGTSMERILDNEGGEPLKYFSVDGRTFVSANNERPESDLYELVDGGLHRLGPSMNSIVEFEGELFGVHFPNPLTQELWRTQNGQFVPLGNAPVGSQELVEFGGQLYFGGRRMGTSNATAQLYAIVPVPEPSSFALVLGLLVGAQSIRRIQLGRPRLRA